MIRLFVVVEGQTEELFVKSVLAPHLQALEIWTTPVIVETSRSPGGKKHAGGGDWAKWRKQIETLLRSTQPGLRVTTMFDLYGLPDDFPRLEDLRGDPDTGMRCQNLEQAMAEQLGDRRLLPNLLRHEVESLVLASLPELEQQLEPGQLGGLRMLRKELGALDPEDVNDGEHTAPSKRLTRHIVGYRKLTHGIPAVQMAGLAKVRAACPRFSLLGRAARSAFLGTAAPCPPTTRG